MRSLCLGAHTLKACGSWFVYFVCICKPAVDCHIHDIQVWKESAWTLLRKFLLNPSAHTVQRDTGAKTWNEVLGPNKNLAQDSLELYDVQLKPVWHNVLCSSSAATTWWVCYWTIWSLTIKNTVGTTLHVVDTVWRIWVQSQHCHYWTKWVLTMYCCVSMQCSQQYSLQQL